MRWMSDGQRATFCQRQAALCPSARAVRRVLKHSPARRLDRLIQYFLTIAFSPNLDDLAELCLGDPLRSQSRASRAR
jgi:hypothetical protein